MIKLFKTDKNVSWEKVEKMISTEVSEKEAEDIVINKYNKAKDELEDNGVSKEYVKMLDEYLVEEIKFQEKYKNLDKAELSKKILGLKSKYSKMTPDELKSEFVKKLIDANGSNIEEEEIVIMSSLAYLSDNLVEQGISFSAEEIRAEAEKMNAKPDVQKDWDKLEELYNQANDVYSQSGITKEYSELLLNYVKGYLDYGEKYFNLDKEKLEAELRAKGEEYRFHRLFRSSDEMLTELAMQYMKIEKLSKENEDFKDSYDFIKAISAIQDLSVISTVFNEYHFSKKEIEAEMERIDLENLANSFGKDTPDDTESTVIVDDWVKIKEFYDQIVNEFSDNGMTEKFRDLVLNHYSSYADYYKNHMNEDFDVQKFMDDILFQGEDESFKNMSIDEVKHEIANKMLSIGDISKGIEEEKMENTLKELGMLHLLVGKANAQGKVFTQEEIYDEMQKIEDENYRQESKKNIIDLNIQIKTIRNEQGLNSEYVDLLKRYITESLYYNERYNNFDVKKAVDEFDNSDIMIDMADKGEVDIRNELAQRYMMLDNGFKKNEAYEYLNTLYEIARFSEIANSNGKVFTMDEINEEIARIQNERINSTLKREDDTPLPKEGRFTRFLYGIAGFGISIGRGIKKLFGKVFRKKQSDKTVNGAKPLDSNQTPNWEVDDEVKDATTRAGQEAGQSSRKYKPTRGPKLADKNDGPEQE